MSASPENQGRATARFDVFSDGARQVLRYSDEEARRFNHNYVGTEHLLLGLMRGENSDPATRVLSNLGINLPRVRSGIEFILGRGEEPTTGNIGLTPRARRVIENAAEEYKIDQVDELTPVHILRGLVREGEGVAARMLETLGIKPEQVREEIIRVQSEKEKQPELTPEEAILGRLKVIFENPAIPQATKSRFIEILNAISSITEREATDQQ